MTNSSPHFNTVVDIAEYLLSGGTLSYDHAYDWLSYLSKEDLTKFIKEYNNIFFDPQYPTEKLSEVIYEWKESAIAIASVELAEAFNAESDEVELTKPN